MMYANIFLSLEWATPWALAFGVGVVLPWMMRLRTRRAGRCAPVVSCVLQSLVLLAVAVAVAGPMVPRSGQAGRAWLVLQDASSSMRGQAELFGSGGELPWPGGWAREEVAFAGALHAGRGEELPAGERRRTFVAAALRLAGGGRFGGVVIHTDGQFQDDGADLETAARALGEAGLPVLIVPADAPPADARIQNLTARQRPDGGRNELTVTVAANARQTRRLRVVREDLRGEGVSPARAEGVSPARLAGILPASGEDGLTSSNDQAHGAHNAGETPATHGAASPVVLLDRPLNLMPDDAQTIRVIDDSPPGGVAVVRAELSPADAFPENDTAQIVLPPVRRRVAVLADAAAPVPALRFPAVDFFTPDASPPADGWLAYDAVLAFDPTGRALRDVGAALERYVQAGGGLVLVGSGPFGSPADTDAPLNRTLPLLTNPFERKPMKLFVVLDASGSMAESVVPPGQQREQVKFHLATEAVLSLQPHLTPADRMVVVTFANQPRRVYDSGDGPADFAALKRALDAVVPTGGTAVVPALSTVAESPNLAGRQGLILLLSDLRTEPFDVPALAAKLRRAELAISVAAVTSPHDDATPDDDAPHTQATPLHALADELHGPFASLSTLDGLARVFAEFLRQGRGDGLHRDGPFDVRTAAGPFGGPFDPPPADAYFLTTPRDGALVLAQVGDDPVLATRTVGLGRTVSLALPISAEQNADWPRWPGWGPFLDRALAWAARPAASGDFSAALERRGEAWRIELVGQSATGPVNLEAVTATVLSPAQPGQPADTRRVPMTQIAPGRYELTLHADDGVAAALAVAGPDGQPLWRGLLPQLPPDEFQHLGANGPMLRRLAERTGGQIVSVDELPAHLRERHVRELTPIGWWFAVAGVVLMLTEWSLTRVRR